MPNPPVPTAAPTRLARDVVSRLAQAFHVFAPTLPGLRAGVLATADGFELAAHRPDNQFRSQNFAAMASSLTAISRAMTKELAFESCERLLLESVSGKIVFQPVVALQVPCTVCVAFERSTTLGHVLWSLDDFVTRLRAMK